MHVDGFRFDLASVLGNTVDKHGFQFSPNAPLLKEILSALPNTKMIAEPWACGDGTYQVGNFPYGWAEWNGKFRDTARKFILMESGTMSEMATRMCGSNDLYQDDGRKPYPASISSRPMMALPCTIWLPTTRRTTGKPILTDLPTEAKTTTIPTTGVQNGSGCNRTEISLVCCSCRRELP